MKDISIYILHFVDVTLVCGESIRVHTHKLCKGKHPSTPSLTGKPRLTKRKLQTSNDENIAPKPKLIKAIKELSDQMDMTEKLNNTLLEEA